LNSISRITRTRTQSTTEAVRALIVGGELRPGERLQAQMLANRLGVSRTPVAEALSILHKEGLLEYAPNCGYGVKQFDLANLLAAFDVRLTLEGLACRLVAEKGLAPQRAAAIRDNLRRAERVLFDGAWSHARQDEWRALNTAFHDFIIDGADNAYLRAGVDNTRVLPLIYDRAMRHIGFEQVVRRFEQSSSQLAYRDHERIFEAVDAGQGARAESMMKEHIYTNRENMRRHLEGMLDDGGAEQP